MQIVKKQNTQPWVYKRISPEQKKALQIKQNLNQSEINESYRLHED